DPELTAWAARGEHRVLCGHRVFTVVVPANGPERHAPLLVIHGFPTSSFDFAGIADRLAEGRRVVLLDLVGYGLSAKPDLRYTLDLQADVVAALTAELGLGRL